MKHSSRKPNVDTKYCILRPPRNSFKSDYKCVALLGFTRSITNLPPTMPNLLTFLRILSTALWDRLGGRTKSLCKFSCECQILPPPSPLSHPTNLRSSFKQKKPGLVKFCNSQTSVQKRKMLPFSTIQHVVRPSTQVTYHFNVTLCT